MRKLTATLALYMLMLLSVFPVPAKPLQEEMTVSGVQPETAAGDETAGWEETYTYLAGTEERHMYPERIIKNGVLYEMQDTQYDILPLTKTYILASPDMWKGKEYTAPSELDADGLHYTLTDTTPEEWQATGRTRYVYTERTYLEGQEIPETLDVETQDSVTGETFAVTIPRTAVNADGAGWQEGGLSVTVTYDWDNETEKWFLSVGGETYAAESDENPAFESYEAKILAYAGLDGTYCQVTGITWSSDGYQDESGAWKREAAVVGNKMFPRSRAVFCGDVPQPELPMIRYTSRYVSDVTGYLITARVFYQRIEQKESEPETVQKEEVKETEEIKEREETKEIKEMEMPDIERLGILLILVSGGFVCLFQRRRLSKKTKNEKKN